VDVSDVMDLMQQANDAIGNWFDLIVLSDVQVGSKTGCAVVIKRNIKFKMMPIQSHLLVFQKGRCLARVVDWQLKCKRRNPVIDRSCQSRWK
jgi:hypothetical protein